MSVVTSNEHLTHPRQHKTEKSKANGQRDCTKSMG